MHGEVHEVVRITPRLVRVVLGGDGLAEFQSTPFTDQYVNGRLGFPGIEGQTNAFPELVELLASG
jgi:NADPH-dependent ferric siderophore reductase